MDTVTLVKNGWKLSKAAVDLLLVDFFGPQMALAYRLDAMSQGPKNSRFPGPNPLPLALVTDAGRIKSITHGAVLIIIGE
jgi:hypothetical protein